MSFKTILKMANLSFMMLFFTHVSFAGEKKDPVEPQFTISGVINLPIGTNVMFSELSSDRLNIKDTIQLTEGGKFSWTGSEEESTLYIVTFNTADPPGIPIIVENGAKIKLEIDKSDHFKYKATGGKYNTYMVELHNVYTLYDQKMKAFNARIESIDPTTATPELQKQITAEYNGILMDRTIAIEEFVKTTPGSPATFFAVRYLFSKPVPKLVLIAADVMEKDIPESGYTKQVLKVKADLPTVIEGAMAPNIKLPSPNGDSIELSSLRGKVVLLDFWASWCGPCRKENPHVRALYEEYKDKGFEIYGVSLDNKPDMWKAAIIHDSIAWVHVSDLVGWKSPAAKLYDVHSIPQTFLIDKDGRIAFIGLRSVQLEDVLKEMLN